MPERQLPLGLLEAPPADAGTPRELAPGARLLRGFALSRAPALWAAVEAVAAAAPFRHMQTPGGLTMSVGLTNCGQLGWVSDRGGYRYTTHDPESGRAWPAFPAVVRELALEAAARAGFPHFAPDACLVNRYVPGARLTLHQDKDEHDYDHPIVSVSLGLPAMFLFGGHKRSERAERIPLVHGDVVVWGGPARLRYHGVLPLREGSHPLLGSLRINLTLRKAGP
jgi:alkylated DNA repair protein (DNA oxidative demethylase)